MRDFSLNRGVLEWGHLRGKPKSFIWSLSLFFESHLLWKSLLITRSRYQQDYFPRAALSAPILDSCRCPLLGWIKPGLRMWWSGWISLVWFHQQAAACARLEITSRVGLWEFGVATRTFFGENLINSLLPISIFVGLNPNCADGIQTGPAKGPERRDDECPPKVGLALSG